MAQERLAPDAILDQTNLTGSVADIQNDPDSPDGNWLLTTAAGASVLRNSYGTPTNTPTTGAGLQNFRCGIRKNATGGNDVGWSLQLYENGTLISVLATGTTSSTTGEVVAGTWDASSLGTADGSLVEIRIEQTSGHTGTPANRRYLEINADEWNAEVSAATTHEGTVTLTSSVGLSESALADYFTSVALAASLDASPAALAAFEGAVAYALSVSDSESAAGSIFNPTLGLAFSAAQTAQSTASFGVAVSYDTLFTQAAQGGGILDADVTFAAALSAAQAISVQFDESLALGAGFSFTPAALITLDGQLSLAASYGATLAAAQNSFGLVALSASLATTPAAAHVLQGSITLGLLNAEGAVATQTLEATVVLDAALADQIARDGAGSLEAQLSLGAQLATQLAPILKTSAFAPAKRTVFVRVRS